MKKKLLRLLKMVSIYSFIGVCMQIVFINIIFADNSFAQKNRKMDKVKFNLILHDASLEEAFEVIEEKTDFKFTYEQKDLDPEVRLNYQSTLVSLKKVLVDISKQASLSFRQINNNIDVRKTDQNAFQTNTVSEETVLEDIKITGRVTESDNNEGLPGVNVLVKGTYIGTVTDIDGNYVIEVPSKESVLLFSSIGYVTEEVQVGDQTTINMLMVPDITSLNEIVVVGYGEQKKETLTGSIANISGDEVVKSPSANVSSSLAGKLPGLTISQRSGEPGRDDPNILIRGRSSFSETEGIDVNAPLIIVDGVPRSLMGRLNPDDIESISVLKDASAAIYGARAANGVILITTKKGKKGKPVFSLSYNHAFQRPTKVMDMLDAATFAEVFNEAEWYRRDRPVIDENYSPFYSKEAIQKYRDGSDPVLYPNTDWISEVLKPYSTQQKLSLSARGGTDATSYFLSFASVHQDGTFKNDPTNYKQYNMRVKLDAKLTDNLTVGANLSAILNDRNYSSIATDQEVWVNFHNIYQANPTLVSQYPNGLIAPGRLGENPLLLNQRGYMKIEDVPLYTTFTASYYVPFVDGLKLDASYNYDLSNQHQKRWKLPYFYHEYNTVTGEYDKIQGTDIASPELWDTYKKWTNELYNFRISYEKDFERHHVNIMVGTEQETNKYSMAEAYRKNFVSNLIDQINQGGTSSDDKGNSGSATTGGYNNYFGRLNYDFDGKYLVELLFRNDGSQKFPSDIRYGFFPGMSAGWRISEEPFMQNLSFVNQMKLRASFGKSGNDGVKPYQFLQTFGFSNSYPFGGKDASGISPNRMPNPNITWETSQKMDFGVESLLWDGLFGMEFTLWQEKRSDILCRRNVSISNVFGFSDLPDENIGKTKSHGFELVLTHENALGDLNYQVSANTAFSRSKIEYMDEVPQEEPYKNQTGHPIGAQLYYKADGIFNTQEEIDNYPHIANTQLGDIKVVDLNHDGVIDGNDQFRFDYTSTPEYIFGLNIDLQYKNFDMNLFFQGQTNAYNYDDRFSILGSEAFDNATVERAKDRWTVDNPDGTMPRADAAAPGNSTMWLFDATFVRLKNVELGYTLPEELVSKVGLTDARFYVSGFNMLTWAKEIKWADPEANGGFLYYPQLRVINLGVNVKF